jgi:hypothetical protein
MRKLRRLLPSHVWVLSWEYRHVLEAVVDDEDVVVRAVFDTLVAARERVKSLGLGTRYSLVRYNKAAR